MVVLGCHQISRDRGASAARDTRSHGHGFGDYYTWHRNLEWSAAVSGAVWEAKVWGKVWGLLKAELKRRNVTYAQLVVKLVAIGVVDSEPNIRNTLARGKFTAVFLVPWLEVVGSSD